MNVAIIIPARYASSRYPGKPLVAIRGADGEAKSLIRRSYEAASRVPGIGRVYVATDDERIADAAAGFGADVLMTPESCANGTERVAAALDALDPVPDLLVNFQGDALLTPPAFVTALIDHMVANPQSPCATAAVECSPGAYSHLVADQMAGRSGGTTVVRNAAGDALYFSKRVLPFIADDKVSALAGEVLLHLGLYAYRQDALRAYMAAEPSFLEQVEGLEQLRFLHHGIAMHVVRLPPADRDLIELNNPTDLAPIESILSRHGIA